MGRRDLAAQLEQPAVAAGAVAQPGEGAVAAAAVAGLPAERAGGQAAGCGLQGPQALQPLGPGAVAGIHVDMPGGTNVLELSAPALRPVGR